MKFGKMVDLSYSIDPKKETRYIKIDYVELERYGEIFPGYVVTKADKFYPMHTLTLASHIGTHLEAPYHWNRKGKDLAELPLDNLIGEAVVLNLTHIPCDQMVTKEDVVKAAQQAGMKSGDMVFCHTQYYVDAAVKSPFYKLEAIKWLVDQKIRLLGVEGEMENLLIGDELEDFPNHTALFEKGIPMIEYVTNLDALLNTRFLAITLPAKIVGLESIPVRVVGIELL